MQMKLEETCKKSLGLDDDKGENDLENTGLKLKTLVKDNNKNKSAAGDSQGD